MNVSLGPTTAILQPDVQTPKAHLSAGARQDTQERASSVLVLAYDHHSV